MAATIGRKAPRARLLLEALEERCLLAGTITELPILTAGAAPYGIVTGPDGNLWFTEQSTNRIAKMSLLGALTEYNVPTAASMPTGIVSGPDGNLWFTEQSGSKIAKVTTNGVFTEYIPPTASASLFGITVGPDNNIWFTEQSGNKVVKVTTSGFFTEYSVPTASSMPTEIVSGPDGNLWFTEQSTNKIGRVTTNGIFMEFTVPTASSTPFGITVGPDGALWFTEESANKIGRVTTIGQFIEYPVPTAGSSPYAIVKATDNNLYFTEQSANKIGAMNASGVATEFVIPTPTSGAAQITVGPDSNLYFTEQTANKIGKLLITSPPPSPPPPPPSGGGGSTSPPPPPPPLPVSPFPTPPNGSRIGVQLASVDATGTVTLDNNGDGKFDTGDSTFTFGISTDTYVTGDWNGSGFDSVGVVRGTASGVAYWTIDTNEDQTFDAGDAIYSYGLNTDKFVAGDWTGGGVSKIGIARALPDGTLEWILNTSGSGVYSGSDVVYNFGLGSDTPITGNWNGAGKSEIGIVRQTPSGVLQWALDTNGDGVFDGGDSVYNFGVTGDTAVVGDWSGSGTDKIGIARPQTNGTSIWALDVNGNGIYDPPADNVFAFGQASVDFLTGFWPPLALRSGDGVVNGPVQPLQRDANFQVVVNQAILAWTQAGLTPQQVARLQGASYGVGTLNGGLLGQTFGDRVVIDATGQGNGWSESAAPQPGRMDLLTGLEHEMGHLLGLPDQATQPNDLLYASLLPGVRKAPSTQDVDAVFIGWE